MPEIGRIQSTNFQALLTELGIVRSNIPFALRSEVTPVVLVGGTVSFLASPTPAYRVQDVFTAGTQLVPPVDTNLADTGPLPIGAYSVKVFFFANESASLVFQWRDAANAANLYVQEFVTGPAGEPRTLIFDLRFDVANDNERFRMQNRVVGGVGSRYQATILART